jgi:hypothetical protein
MSGHPPVLIDQWKKTAPFATLKRNLTLAYGNTNRHIIIDITDCQSMVSANLIFFPHLNL